MSQNFVKSWTNESLIRFQSGAAELIVCPRSGKILALNFKNSKNSNFSLLVPPFESELKDTLLGLNCDRTQFESADAWGWDECWPTVGAHPAGLRDHGEIWGRQAVLESGNESGNENSNNSINKGLFQNWNMNENVFSRKVTQKSGQGFCQFEFTLDYPSTIKLNDKNIECLYASHALFIADTDDELKWENDSLFFPHETEKQANKFFISGNKFPLKVEFFRHKIGIKIELEIQQNKTDCESNQFKSPCFGIWWCNNAWGDGRHHRTVGIEATSHLGDGPIFTTKQVQSRTIFEYSLKISELN